MSESGINETLELEASLGQLAAGVFAEIGLDDPAPARLAALIETDPELRRKVLFNAARAALHDAKRKVRAAIAGTGPLPKTYSAASTRAVQQVCSSLLNWPLSDGTPLREATRPKIDAEIAMLDHLVSGVNARRTFLAAVRGRFPDDVTTVEGAGLGDAELRPLLEKARAGK